MRNDHPGTKIEPSDDHVRRGDDLRTDDVLWFGPFSLFLAARQLKRDDESVPVGGRALDVLITLLARAGEIISNKELVARVWPNVIIEEANLRVHIAALRKALDDGIGGARYISNVAGRGYCFVASVTRTEATQRLPTLASAALGRIQRLPGLPTRMVGREESVRTLLGKLMTCRLVTIVGPGGVGKTTVAAAVAHALVESFQGAVFFVDLGALADPYLVPTAVATALGLMMTLQDPLLTLIGGLRDKRILLVLDNCEHLIDATAQLGERILNEAPQTHILATSREALRAEGEHIHLLYSLDTPPDHPDLRASEALKFPAVQLFMQRAVASGHRPELSDSDAPVVANICRRLDGIALAIELAASRVGSLGIGGTAELLDNRFRGVWNARRTALPRHQTLQSMLDWSYNLLTEPEKRVFCRLSIFVGEFTIAAACDVVGDDELDDESITESVTALVAKSLVSTTQVGRSIYHRLLDTTRAYALLKLADRRETDRLAQRHAATFRRYLGHGNIFQSANDEHLVAQIGNIRAAIDWALSAEGDRVMAVEVVACAAPLLNRLSLLNECRVYSERALVLVDETFRGTQWEMILQKEVALSSMFTKGNSSRVRSAIARGLELAEHWDDRPHQFELLAGLNIFLTRIGDFQGALDVALRAMPIAQADKTPISLVTAEWMLGVSHHLVGNQEAAQHHCESGMVQAAALGGPASRFFGYDHRVRALVALARALWLQGNSRQALKTAQQAIDEAADKDEPVSVCISLIYGSPVFRWMGDLDRSEYLVDRLVENAERYSLAPYQAVGIALKGELALARGETEEGLRLLREALEVLYAEQHNVLLTVFTASLAEGLLKAGQFEEALLTINGAMSRPAGFGSTFDMAELLRLKAEVLAKMPQGDRDAAAKLLKEAMRSAHEQFALVYELRSATSLARLFFDDGQRDDARGVLKPIYDRLKEDIETPDLKSASDLLATLG
ncbi:winged helix-turn-helix domain-containing protein [Bradyrhizobium sp. Ash2021]|uniref:ATP-binding protein n=1 Tax=Bradyrhizobium sp. Ash2021 TaxID=2954771 RepID=UPI002815EFD3|nr:winged helix-turn-helix domain-containing protein [Bradyrhizobium sp. Ash2021]WMT76361.1 winged helix-turn-helix domain-containing protein [Bradyrhizobium sp. Ash2021]